MSKTCRNCGAPKNGMTCKHCGACTGSHPIPVNKTWPQRDRRMLRNIALRKAYDLMIKSGAMKRST